MKEKDSAYDTAVQKHIRGEIPASEVWKADPYDSALQRMAERATKKDSSASVKSSKSGQKVRLD